MVDLKEEQKYEQLKKLAQELHIPLPEAFWTLEVFDKDGKLLQKHHQRSHSWTRNAYNHLFCEMVAKDADDATFEAGKLSGKDTGGLVKNGAGSIAHKYDQTLDAPDASYGILTPADQDIKGIQVGSGTDAESFEDCVLQTKIVSGSGPDELSYVASEDHSISYADTTLQDEQVRYFNNNSGGNVEVNEVALVDGIYVGTIAQFFLMSRDKLGATVTVPDTGQLKVTYTIQLAYPA